MERNKFRDALLRFIREDLGQYRKEALAEEEIASDTLLFEGGYINSLGVVELIAFIEETLHISVSMREVIMKHFGSVDAICERFLENRDARLV